MAKLDNSMSPRLPSSLEGDNENEHALSRSLAAESNNNNRPWQTVLRMSKQTRRNSHSHNSFYSSGRQVPGSVFFINLNIFNFSHQTSSSSSSSSSSSIFDSIIHILLNFLEIQSSGTRSPSPIELRPMAFMVSVGCSVAYNLASSAKFMFPGFASQFGVLMSVFGSLAVATLISLTLQLPWWSILLILILQGGFFKLLNKLHATYGKIRRRPRPRTMQPHLPLYNVIFNR